MVFFTCNSCGEAIKKNQVENHCLKCRKCEILSCMDCNKDFYGDEYKNHIKCVSEKEKYSGKDYQPKEGENKGEKKQDAWMENIRKAAENLTNDLELKNLLETLSQCSNIPRKETKFQNFMMNALKIGDQTLIEKVWDVIQNKQQNEADKKEIDEKNGKDDSKANKESKSKKRKHEGEDEIEKKGDSELKPKEKKSKSKKRKSEMNGSENACEEVKKVVEPTPSEKQSKKKNRKQKETNEISNDNSEDAKQQSKKDNAKNGTNDVEESKEVGNFKWRKTAKLILSHSSENSMTLKKLKKKVLEEYKNWSRSSDTIDKKEIYKTIESELFKQKFQLEDDVVKLVC